MSMGESFAQLFEESLNETPMIPGAIIVATVIDIKPDFVIVSAGLKSESLIPREQFQDEHGKLEVSMGDEVQVALDTIEDGFGTTRLSRERAKRVEAWTDLEQAYKDKEIVRVSFAGVLKAALLLKLVNQSIFAGH